VILIDEIEKGHPEIFNLFLQMLDEGHITNSHGVKVSFKNCVILMTSNVGTKVIKDFGTGVGFNTAAKLDNHDADVRSTLEKELKKKFAPEFINRIDEIVYFKDLDEVAIRKIATIELNKSIDKLGLLGHTGIIDDSLLEHLILVGYDPQYGARPMKRAIQRWVDDPLTEILLEEPVAGSTMILSYNKEKDETKVEVKKPKRKSKEKE
jgi:ATP-dependent Clp protease ATP-binding subunit ClpC